jgi:hypothetical protein
MTTFAGVEQLVMRSTRVHDSQMVTLPLLLFWINHIAVKPAVFAAAKSVGPGALTTVICAVRSAEIKQSEQHAMTN